MIEAYYQANQGRGPLPAGIEFDPSNGFIASQHYDTGRMMVPIHGQAGTPDAAVADMMRSAAVRAIREELTNRARQQAFAQMAATGQLPF
jgi:hypothetical protein